MSETGVGQPAPTLKQKAFPTNRSILVPHPNGTPTLLVFMGYQTASRIEGVVSTVRRVFPDPARLLIVNVIDLQNVPRLMQGAAKKIIKTAYEQGAAKIPDGYEPETQLVLLTDWRGKVTRAYGVSDANRALALVLVDGSGQIAERYQGADAEARALDMVLKLLDAS